MHRPQSAAPGFVLALFLFFQFPSFRFLFPAVQVETTADLFDTGTLQELRLNINSKDLRQLRARYQENTYYPADLIWRDLRVRNVAIRSRGFDSRNPTKLGLQIDMDRYTRSRTFLGLRSLVLDNFVQDPAMMREPLAMAIFARMGQPAPRESFCRLYLNNDYQGLYAIVEDIDQPFLARTFGQDDGYLFEYHWLQPFYGEYPGDDLALYKPIFEARTHQLWPDEMMYAPIRTLFESFNSPEGATGRDDLDQYLDLEQFITVLAIENLMGDEDGIVGVHGMNNFYLHRYAGSTRHSVVMWDRDRAFTLLRWSLFERLDRNVLARRALSYDDLFDLYLRVLEDCARSVSDGGWLQAEVDRLSALVAPAVYADIRKPYSNQEFEAAVAFLREFAAGQPDFVLEEVAAVRAGRR